MRVFNIFDSSAHDTHAHAVASMKARFRSLDIPKLYGLDFHPLTQKNETINQRLQRLCCKAFPNSTGEDRDWLLKRKFFKALLQKCQRKVGAPNLEELHAVA